MTAVTIDRSRSNRQPGYKHNRRRTRSRSTYSSKDESGRQVYVTTDLVRRVITTAENPDEQTGRHSGPVDRAPNQHENAAGTTRRLPGPTAREVADTRADSRIWMAADEAVQSYHPTPPSRRRIPGAATTRSTEQLREYVVRLGAPSTRQRRPRISQPSSRKTASPGSEPGHCRPWG